MFGHAQMIKILLGTGVDVNMIPQSEFHTHASPLHQAVSSGDIDAVKLLVEAGANLHAIDSIYHGTALGWAKFLKTEQTIAPTKNYAAIEEYLQSRTQQ